MILGSRAGGIRTCAQHTKASESRLPDSGLGGFRVWGLGFRVWGLGFEVWGLGFRVFGMWCSGISASNAFVLSEAKAMSADQYGSLILGVLYI